MAEYRDTTYIQALHDSPTVGDLDTKPPGPKQIEWLVAAGKKIPRTHREATKVLRVVRGIREGWIKSYPLSRAPDWIKEATKGPPQE